MEFRVQVRSIVERTIVEVANEQDKRLPPLSDELPVLDTGLDSLCLAVIVARLEDALGADPFSRDEDVVFPTTVGEFIRLYEEAAH